MPQRVRKLQVKAFAVGVALSVLAALVWQRWLSADTSRRVMEQAMTFEGHVQSRMASYAALLRGAVGLFAFRTDVSRSAFHRYVSQLRLERNYPGTQGIGFTLRIAPERLPEMEQRFRREGFPEFRVWPGGAREEYHAIVFLEPEDERNLAAIGYDMHTEPQRRAAMDRAAESGQPALTGRVTLVQEIRGPKQAGFLIYVPVFDDRPEMNGGGSAPLLGYVYAPLRAGDFFGAHAERMGTAQMTVAVFDGLGTNSENLLFGELPAKTQTDWWAVRRTHQLTVVDRTWTFLYSAPISGVVSPWMVLLAGIAISFGGAMLLGREQRALQRAELSEAETREREGELALVIQAMPGLVTFVDREGVIRLFNSRLEEWYGRSAEELIGKRFGEVMTPEMWMAFEPILARSLAGEVVTFERWINPSTRHADYPARYVSTVLVPHRTRAGEISGVYAFASDLTERKRDEENARFVADCGKLLIGTTDMVPAMVRVAQLAVPRIADAAAILEVKDGWLHITDVAYADREMAAMLTAAFRAQRLPVTTFAGLTEAVQSQRVVVVPRVDPAALAPLLADPARGGLMEQVQLASALHIPVIVRGEVRAVVTLGATAISGRRFRPGDHTLGEEVATRLQLAVENSLLLSEMKSEIEVRSRAERSARESEERFRLLVEGARDYAMLLLDTNGLVDAWNPGAERLLGFTEDEAIGMPFDALFHAEDRAAGIPQRELEGARMQGSVPDERWHVRKDGTRFWASGHTVVLRDDKGVITGFAKIMRDLTGWKRSEEDLERRVRERTAELNDAVQELEAFSYSVSHDLRSPLRSIQSFTQFTIEEAAHCLAPEQRDYLNRVQQAAARLDRLISDLLAYTRVSKNRVPLEPVDLDALMSDIRRDHPEFQAPRAQVAVVGPLGKVIGNEAYLTQSLTNLIGNAVKFVAPGRTPDVRLWTTNLDGHVRLHVQDNGIGVPPEHHDRIFRIFERLHPRGEFEGTGVGLAIVRRALQRMNGTVGVEPAPDGGSIFWIELPVAPTDEVARRA